MFYAPFRRMRAAATIYLGIIAALAISAAVIVFITNGGRFQVVHPNVTTVQTTNGVMTVTVTDSTGKTVVHTQKTKVRGTSTTVHGRFVTDQDMLALIVVGMTYALAFLSTGLGLTFAAENEGHLEFAWTRPITRERYALGIVAVDLAGMLVAFLLSIAIVALGVLACGGIEFFATSHVRAADFGPALLGLGLPILMYAWIAALSASLRRGRAFAILIWPAMGVLALFATQTAPGSPFKPVLVWLNTYVNPLAIFAQDQQHDLTIASTAYGLAFAALLIAATIGQWRRLEA